MHLNRLPSHFYLFSYGANDVHNLAKRLFGDKNVPGTTEQVAMICRHTSTAFLPHYIRTFFGYSSTWKGGVGSLLRTDSALGTWGLLTEVSQEGGTFIIGDTPIHLETLARVEGVDDGMYEVTLVSYTHECIPIYAFIGCIDRENQSFPSEKYLQAMGALLHTCFPDAEEIHIPIRLGQKEEILDVYPYRVH